ncbi:MAG: type I methionyl aminopeptidase [Gammaproteobacteria bacterium]|nr:type I methionyl aminopeptidase [Shewanella sp. Pdp11]EGT3626245.1 type I methionyl aminopeptidase [Morganella morganii]MBU1393296.1 type I methionyl aminopeptidase [Gammaproteobacteria bacterium]MCL1133432.1 type I methionyl aminopeptidase [Shewanella hafniensis]QYX66120.1 type I methionyl aminopeptidase [Shewanella putrefaciens]AUD59806.1 type I methionyl aminopeptidase [Shewanella sp. Pdp11]
MSIVIKTAEEIEKMRAAGKLAAQVLEMIAPYVKPGVTTNELNDLCAKYTEEQGAISAPLNYHGFPKSICTSVNNVICHGIPNDNPPLKEGDILNIDITVIKDGYHGDTSMMFLIGEVSAKDKRLCRIAQESLYLAIRKVRPGLKLGEIGNTIEKFIKASKTGLEKYSIVQDYCGHGIGSGFHEEPQVMHYRNGDNTVLRPGMCFTIEPMINAGRHTTILDRDDKWTVTTSDGKNSAQWEHTLLVTEKGVEVLTLREDEDFPRIINHER